MNDIDQSLSDFMSNTDLQLRNRLAVLLPSLDLLEKRLADTCDPKVRVYLGEARRTAFSILRMSNNMRDYAKYLAGYDFAEPESIDLTAMLGSIIREAERLTEYTPLNICFQASETPFIAYLDPLKIERLFYNLLSNAVLHGGGDVSIMLERAEGSIILRVRNNGRAIDSHKMARIFEGYRDFEPDSQNRLGLPLALAIACQSGGTLMVDSDEKTGTAVTVSLPDIQKDDTFVVTGVPYTDYTGFFKHFLVEMSDICGCTPLFTLPAETTKANGDNTCTTSTQ